MYTVKTISEVNDNVIRKYLTENDKPAHHLSLYLPGY